MNPYPPENYYIFTHLLQIVKQYQDNKIRSYWCYLCKFITRLIIVTFDTGIIINLLGNVFKTYQFWQPIPKKHTKKTSPV